MADSDMEAKDIERKVHDLASAMSRIKSAQATRDDVVVDMKHSKVGRLELLANDLAPVFNELPKANDQFEFAITNGQTPRLWIDMTSFVRMGKDGREYQFVKDTRLGRTILGQTENREKIGARITDYVAERVLERERALEGDWITVDGDSEGSGSSEKAEARSEGGSFWLRSIQSAYFWFCVGFVAALAGMFILISNDQTALIVDWVHGVTGRGG